MADDHDHVPRGLPGRMSLIEKGLLELEEEFLSFRLRMLRQLKRLTKKVERINGQLSKKPPGSKP